MNFENCVKERRSVRKFTEEKISHETFEKIIELARFAPSWKNSQTARYHIIENEDIKTKVAEEAVMNFVFNEKTIKRAPALVVLTAVGKKSGYEEDGTFSTSKEDRWEVFDAGIACQTFCLSAYNEGVGSVVLGIFDDKKVKEICEIPEEENVMALIAVGYRDGEAKAAPERLEVKDLVSFK